MPAGAWIRRISSTSSAISLKGARTSTVRARRIRRTSLIFWGCSLGGAHSFSPLPIHIQALHQLPHHRFRISKQHPGLVEEVQLVVDAGEARVLAALHREDRARAVRVDD